MRSIEASRACGHDGSMEHINWDDETPPELSEAELEAEYMEQIELAAASAPPNVFDSPVHTPLSLTPQRWAEFRDFLRELPADDLRKVGNLARTEYIIRKPAGVSSPSSLARRAS